MQPVTIKNNQYSNTLWLTQAYLCLLVLMIVWVAVIISIWLILLLPIIALALLSNHKTIKQQRKLQFSMRSNGQLVLVEHAAGDSIADNKLVVNHDEGMIVEIKAFWHLPQVLLLKLSAAPSNKPIYLALFRPVLGASDFSQLLVGLTQMNASLQNSHDHSK